jgi:ATP-binding cassette subfamily C protein CydC
MLVLVILATMAAFEPVLPLYAAFQYLGQTHEAAKRLSELVAAPPAVVFPGEGPETPLDAGIRMENVRFAYVGDRLPALADIDLDVAPGERLAIVGQTGSGKTTLFHLLVRFWDPTGGSIYIGGLPVKDFSEDALRRQVGVVSQEAHLFTASIRDNLIMARPGASDGALWNALETARLAGFVKSLPEGLDTWVGVSGRMLSGGQARRLAVARTVLKNPPIWLLDEPTEGLDAENERQLMEEVLDAAVGKTLVVITHRPVGLAAMDRVILLERGRIVASGSHTALLAAGGRYGTLFASH